MDIMEFLYRVMEELAAAHAPIVFKGAMVLNLAIKGNNPSKVERVTRDIDGDWVGEAPAMTEMENVLWEAVTKVDSSMKVQAGRVFDEKKSAGFKILNGLGEKIASVDLDVRQNNFCSSYISYVSGVPIEGASLSKMLSDKIYAISGERVYRRVKDLLDIYVISFLGDVDLKELHRIWEATGRELGNFKIFREHFAELNEGYNKMKGIINKPDFEEVYTRVNEMIDEINKSKHRERL